MSNLPFDVGDRVIDLTAELHDWPDKKGVVVKVDGGQVLVRYDDSGNERWKQYINLRLSNA